MPRRTYGPDEIIAKLRQADVLRGSEPPVCSGHRFSRDKGIYYFTVSAVDVAGNAQSRMVRNKLTVK